MRIKAIAIISCIISLSIGTGAAQTLEVKEAELQEADTSLTILSLEDALKIAMSENIAVRVADKEVERAEYAKKGTYASLFPKIDASAVYQRTIKKQVMYMDFDLSKLGGGGGGGGGPMPSGGGIEVGRWNTYNAGVSASMPIVNAQLWKSLSISGEAVELAIEKARSSRLEMITQVKQAYYSVLLAKEAFNVYKSVYDNALENSRQTENRLKASKASELEALRAKTNVANAIPNLYNAESSIFLALWQLKAVVGLDLDKNIDVSGRLDDYESQMLYDTHSHDSASVENNSMMRQLQIQSDQLAETILMRKYAYLPTLAVNFSYSMNAMSNDFNFSEYRWTPYSYVGISLSIPIFSGGKRYNEVRQAKVQATELELQRINTERQLKISIRQFINSMEKDMKSYFSAQEAIQMAQKAYNISAASYNLGKNTITDLNDAQLALTQVRLTASQAIYNFIVAKSKLEQTLGLEFSDESGSAGVYSQNFNSSK